MVDVFHFAASRNNSKQKNGDPGPLPASEAARTKARSELEFLASSQAHIYSQARLKRRRRRGFYPRTHIDFCPGHRGRETFNVVLLFSRRDRLVWGPYQQLNDAIEQKNHVIQAFCQRAAHR